MCSMCVFCFFKQKTAYEMRISDWSSDVCSSDLIATGASFSATAEAARDLVGYGYDLSGSFKENLVLITQMRDGLGVATRSSAEMVAIYDRQLKAPVREIADAIARVANDTALAADRKSTRLNSSH